MFRTGRSIICTVLFATFAYGAPAKKTHHAPPTVPHDEPDTTGAIPKAKSPGATTNVENDKIPEPFHLPSAPRSRMRECGVKWQEIKMAGGTGDETWRSFATKCLAGL